MEEEAIYVGIDVAKAGMDIAVCPSEESWTTSNDEAGIRRLVSRLKGLKPALVNASPQQKGYRTRAIASR